jgi:ankyrin repeat protein
MLFCCDQCTSDVGPYGSVGVIPPAITLVKATTSGPIAERMIQQAALSLPLFAIMMVHISIGQPLVECCSTISIALTIKLPLFFIHIAEFDIMARKKAHKQPAAQLPAFVSLDRLLARAKTGVTQRVKEYIDGGGSPTRQVEVASLDGDTATVPLLHSLCLSSHDVHAHLAGSIELLIKAGAQIDSTCIDPFGDSRTALMWACEVASSGGCTHPIEALLTAGADVNAVSVTDGATAVGIAAARGIPEAVRVLLQHGADLCIKDNRSLDAVGWAAGTWRMKVLQLLLEHDTVMFNSCAPLVAAAAYEQLDCARWLLSKGAQRANINAFDYRGWTALRHATSNKHGERMLQLLLDNGADARACNEAGRDALSILACHSGKVHCAELLLAAGADATYTDHNGNAALHIAVEQQHRACAATATAWCGCAAKQLVSKGL